LRQWDRHAADRVDRFVAISRTVQRRIRKYYRREAPIIYPPVRTEGMPIAGEPEDYYLIVSRLVPYKRIDLAVAAFNALGLPLRIIGSGRDRAALEAMAQSNIRFLGYLPDDEVRQQMARCRAFIFPGEEDFGLTPLEAMAAGRPVIAYGAGGALDYVEEGVTGLLFDSPEPDALAEAVQRMGAHRFDPETLRRQAERFSVERFREEMGAFLDGAAIPPGIGDTPDR
jgi:glycosyltransferase involved in cell wall biosynthesis